MSIGTWIQDAEALIALEPVLMKFIEDARAAAPALEADAEALKTQLLAIFHPAPATVPSAIPPTSNLI